MLLKTDRSQVQIWSTHGNIYPLKILDLFHSFKIVIKIYLLFAFVSPTLSVVNSSISCPCRRQYELLVGLPTVVVVALTDPSSFLAMTDTTPNFTKFGFVVTTESLPKFIPPHELASTLGSPVNFPPTILLKLGLALIFSSKSINGSSEVFGAADPLRTRGTYSIENILCPSPPWGVGGTVEKLNWGIQPGG